MKIGTISFEVRNRGDDKVMVLPAAERLGRILAALNQPQPPQLLVGAGYTLGNVDDLEQLADSSLVRFGQTHLVIEVANDSSPDTLLVSTPTSRHRVYLISPGGSYRSLGRQAFTTSAEAAEADRLTALEGFIPEKTAAMDNLQLLTLCCGEINVLQGRDKVRCRSPIVGKAIEAADLIVNPTHDRMGNAGTLKAKRTFLSEPGSGRRRLYVSSSNWNSAPKGRTPVQKRTASTLHTVFVNGKSLPYRQPIDGSDFEYREWEVV